MFSNEKNPAAGGAVGLSIKAIPGWICGSQKSTKANVSQALSSERLKYLAARLHALGEKPLYNFLDEIERGEPLRPHLERYAALPADFIKALGGDRFAPSLRVIDGGRDHGR